MRFWTEQKVSDMFSVVLMTCKYSEGNDTRNVRLLLDIGKQSKVDGR